MSDLDLPDEDQDWPASTEERLDEEVRGATPSSADESEPAAPSTPPPPD